jgi:hypothetical protein
MAPLESPKRRGYFNGAWEHLRVNINGLLVDSKDCCRCIRIVQGGSRRSGVNWEYGKRDVEDKKRS